eukprot:4120839-Prymnesium_polylepis.2
MLSSAIAHLVRGASARGGQRASRFHRASVQRAVWCMVSSGVCPEPLTGRGRKLQQRSNKAQRKARRNVSQ